MHGSHPPEQHAARLAPAEGDPNNVGHVITTAGGSGPSKQVIRYLTERVVGNGSFGVVFQAKCIETGETVRAMACLLPAPADGAAVVGKAAGSAAAGSSARRPDTRCLWIMCC